MVQDNSAHAAIGYAIGLSGAAVSLLLLVGGTDLRVRLAGAFLAGACIIDTRCSRIPNWLTLGLVAGVVTYGGLSEGWGGLGHVLLGALTGLSLFLVPYLMGGMGGGDVKALAGLGTLVGPGSILHVGLYTALAGGVLSILHYACGPGGAKRLSRCRNALVAFAVTGSFECLRFSKDRERLRFPYAAAIGFGFFAYVHWGPVW